MVQRGTASRRSLCAPEHLEDLKYQHLCSCLLAEADEERTFAYRHPSHLEGDGLTTGLCSKKLGKSLNAESCIRRVDMARPVERSDTRLINEVHERLREMIATGELLPDTRLFQERLAASLGVSRTPLREALLRLEREGLVYTVPGRGMFVQGLVPEQAGDLYQLRWIIEPFAARLACESATPAQLERIEAIQAKHEREYPVDVITAFKSNFDLHTSLVEECPNRRMYEMLCDLWAHNSVLLMFGYYTHNVGAVSNMVAEHREIVDAFIAHDCLAVEQLLKRHIEEASESLLKSLQGYKDTGREI